MPYSGASDKSLPSNVKKMPTAKKKAWVATFNNVYKTCISDGGSTTSCETKAFKIANGNAKKKKQMIEEIQTRNLLNRVWGGFLDSIGVVEDDKDFELVPRKAKTAVTIDPAEFDYRLSQIIGKGSPKTRSTSMERVLQQLYQLLRDKRDDGDEWAYPTGLYIGDDGKSIFSVVAQSGKLYSVPLTVSKDTVEMGEWTQVKEEFSPITQSTFSVLRQKDGTYRWFCIAGTTVLNRDGEIDSSELFDSFVERAEKTGEYPRLDFYHQGSSDPDLWEFGTADYLARDGVCYIASGTFDKDHPLARAAIKACMDEDCPWGNSIEFYANSEPELILADPEVRIPVYKDGENTRISIVKEEDAAGLFTRMGVKGEVKRVMDKKTKEALKELFGDDEDGFKKFVESSDTVNRTVKDDKLIHRKKRAVEAEANADEETEDEETDEEELDEEDDGQIVIDEGVVEAIAQQMTQTPEFKTMADSLETIKKAVADMVVSREKDQKEITQLKKDNTQLVKQVERLSKDEDEKQTEWAQDLPSRRQKHVTYRPKDEHKNLDGMDDALEEDLSEIAKRTLSALPSSY